MAKSALWGLVSFGLLLNAFRDIRSAVKRSDGLWNVVCMDYRVEVGVTYQAIVADSVCK